MYTDEANFIDFDPIPGFEREHHSILGWGRMGDNASYSDILLDANDIPLLSDEDCGLLEFSDEFSILCLSALVSGSPCEVHKRSLILP